jgi:hypothetical protein
VVSVHDHGGIALRDHHAVPCGFHINNAQKN